MRRVLQKLPGCRVFDDVAGIHHGDPVGLLGHDAEVVRDEDHSHVALPAQVVDQLENLRLNGHVERGRRFVGNQQLRVPGQRHCDHDPLLHAAGELVRIGVDPGFGRGDADQLQQLDDLRAAVGHLRPVEFKHLGDLAADAEHRIERDGRFLENICDAAAADLSEPPRGNAG